MDIPVNALKRIEKNGASIMIDNNKFVGYTQKANWISCDCLTKCFIDKIEKLNSNLYTKYAKNDLYIYTASFNEYEINDIELWLNSIKNKMKDYKLKFDSLIVDD